MTQKPVASLLRILAVLSLALPLGAFAADTPPPLAEMWLISPMPGHSADFNAGVRAHMAFRAEHGDPRAWQAYSPTLGGDLERLAVRYCCISWADVDSYRDWEQKHPEVMQDFEENVAPHMGSVEHYFETADWNNSHWSMQDGGYRLFAVTEFRLKAGHSRDFNQAREKMSQIALQQGWSEQGNMWLWLTGIGGSPRQAIVVPHRNFADFGTEQQPFAEFLTEKLGSADAAAALMQQLQDAVDSVDFQIWEHRPDLSMPESR